ncbi:MAG TPA: hypothetical protein VHB99_15480, partial [Pirellulales bacterium]|nr:hypothetical protein [Pirellulales bacterium]
MADLWGISMHDFDRQEASWARQPLSRRRAGAHPQVLRHDLRRVHNVFFSRCSNLPLLLATSLILFSAALSLGAEATEEQALKTIE